MMIKSNVLRFMTFIFFCIGCSDAVAQDQVTTEDVLFVSKTISHSPSLEKYKKQVSHPAYLIDKKTNNGFVVDVGEDTPVKFNRSFTLCIHNSGSIEKQVTDDKGDEKWIIEYEPKL